MTVRNPDPPAVVETHTALLVFVGDEVHKLKKPVDLGFLDFSTRERREAACHAEVAINRRLAPDVYLGVEDVLGPDGRPRDHLVLMRRLPADARLAAVLRRGGEVEPALRRIAHAIAGLHTAAPSDPSFTHLAERDAILANWQEGFTQVRPHLATALDRERWDRMQVLATRYLRGRRPLLDSRIAAGRVRDGHGDLQAEDIFLLPDGPRILDAIEFGERYRWGDGLADVAFLAMDLERLGRPDLAARFLADYADLLGDAWPPTLAHHYIAYRAHVRAKVGVIRAAQVSSGAGAAPSAVDEYVDLALRHLEASQVRLVLVGGPPGTGKSTLAAAVAEEIDAVVLRTDEVRQRTPAAAGEDRYAPAQVAAVYEHLLSDARALLEQGRHVVLDATWADADHRLAARSLAAETASLATELVCTAPAEVVRDRVARRLEHGRDASEATPAVAEAIAARFAAWPEATPIDTTGPVEASTAAARCAVLGA